jgi:hypothetical protein
LFFPIFIQKTSKELSRLFWPLNWSIYQYFVVNFKFKYYTICTIFLNIVWDDANKLYLK